MSYKHATAQARPERRDEAKAKLPLQLGDVVVTPGTRGLPEVSLMLALARHQWGNWGVVCKEDWEANDRALEHGDRILSVYAIDDVKVWVITEWDRSVTTILLPEEY